MPATKLGELTDGRGGEDTIDERSAVQIFQVETTDPLEDQYTAGAALGIPRIGDEHPNDNTIRCIGVSAQNSSESRLLWIVTCTYAIPGVGEGIGLPEPQSLNPNEDLPVIRWITEMGRIPVTAANLVHSGTGKTADFIDDNPSWAEQTLAAKLGFALTQTPVNSAGEIYDTSLIKDDPHLTAQIKFNIPDISSAGFWLQGFVNTVNTTIINLDGLIINPRNAKMQRVNIGLTRERNAIAYRTVDVVIRIAEDPSLGFDMSALDRGYNERDTSIKLKKMTLDDGTSPSSPMLLDGAGKKLTGTIANWHENAIYRTWRVYREREYNDLPFI